LWTLSEDSLLSKGAQVEGTNKRRKMESSVIKPSHFIQVHGGVESLGWMNDEVLVAGCRDHAIKLVDINKSFLVKQSLITESKVPTCLDTDLDSLILAGSEDGVVRLFDIRANEKRLKKS
jgi:WD40 repeat protein